MWSELPYEWMNRRVEASISLADYDAQITAYKALVAKLSRRIEELEEENEALERRIEDSRRRSRPIDPLRIDPSTRGIRPAS